MLEQSHKTQAVTVKSRRPILNAVYTGPEAMLAKNNSVLVRFDVFKVETTKIMKNPIF
jgi:hypothetical protein